MTRPIFRPAIVLFAALVSSANVAAQSTYLGPHRYLEIDRRADSGCDGESPDGSCSVTESAETCPTDCATGADANLVLGNDPADGSSSYAQPACPEDGTCEFLDWSDLPLVPHRKNDVFVPSDPTAFPTSDSCVGFANLIPRQDLAYTSFAHNLDFAYLSVQRRQADGGGTFFWYFTRVAPSLTPGPVSYTDLAGNMQSCSMTEQFFSYDISAGDILLTGDFAPAAGTTALRAYQAVENFAGVDARSAVGSEALVSSGGYLEELPQEMVLAAINTTVTGAGTWGETDETFAANVFVEAALSLQAIPGEASSCGLTYHYSVLTKPSSSSSSDLKDLVGPIPVTLDGCPADSPECADFHCSACTEDTSCSSQFPSLPACQPGGGCGQCSATNQVLCTGDTPYCNVATGRCISQEIFLDGFEAVAAVE